MNDRTYAVEIQTGRLTRWTSVSAAAAWYVLIFFTNMWLTEPHVCEKELVASTLLEANRAGCPGTQLVGNRPRNSCD